MATGFRVIIEGSGNVLAEDAQKAVSFASRLKGLLGVKALPTGAALWISPCNSIHTMFMAFPIDAVFVDGNRGVVAVYHSMGPWRISGIHRGAAGVLELPAGTANACGLSVGDRLSF